MSPVRHRPQRRQYRRWLPIALGVGAVVGLVMLTLVPPSVPGAVKTLAAIFAAVLTWFVELLLERAVQHHEDKDRQAEAKHLARQTEVARAEARRAELSRLQARVPTGPASLLSPARKIVPLLGRDQELASLVAWCTNTDKSHPSDVRFRLITAAGGVGKSRLAEALKDTLASFPIDASKRWQPVTVGRDHEARFVPQIREAYPEQPLLVVVDYADARPNLRMLLEDSLNVDGRIRILMLARTAGRWWDELNRPGDLGALLNAAWPGADLQDVDVPAQQLLDAAAESFARELGLPIPAVQIEGDDRHRALDVTAAGLVAVLRQDRPDIAVKPQSVAITDVLEELLRHEASHWEATAQAARLADRLTEPMRRLLLAAVALLGAIDYQDAKALAKRVLNAFAADCPADDLPSPDQVAFWLKATYPSDTADEWTASVQPDRLAEHLVVTALTHVDIQTQQQRKVALLENLTSAQAAHAMTVLARTVTDRVRHDRHVEIRSFADHLAARLPGDDPALAAVADVVPDPSTRMAPTSLLIAERRLDLARINPTNEVALADRLITTGRFLFELGRPQDALALTEESVMIFRRLAETDRRLHDPALARALNNLSIQRSALGNSLDSIEIAKEVVTIRRRVTKANPNRQHPELELARALNNLAVRFSEIGNPYSALATIERAVAIFRRLADDKPGEYEPDLARALHNLGTRFSAVGQADDALDATQEAVTIRRRLAQSNPDRYEPDLASSLTVLGLRISKVGLPHAALAPIQEAIALRRHLAQANPERYEPQLARALNNLCILSSDLGESHNALALAEEVVTRYQRLAATRPDRYKSALSRALYELGRCLRDVGRSDDALRAMRSSVAGYEAVIPRSSPDYHQAVVLLRRLEEEQHRSRQESL